MSEFMEHFVDVIKDTIFLGDSTQDLQQEIQQNMWSLSRPNGFNESIQDWLKLISLIVENRKQQISQLGQDAIFYLWFDEQACQLRFNLINAQNTSLPFKTNVEFMPTPHKIIEAFWVSNCRDGIPFEELEFEEPQIQSQNVDSVSSNVLQVYKVELITK